MKFKPVVGTRAFAGDIAALECQRSHTLLHGKTIVQKFWKIEQVMSVDRNGAIKSTRSASGETSQCRHMKSLLVSKAVIDAEGLMTHMAQNRSENAEYKTLEQVRECLRPFLR